MPELPEVERAALLTKRLTVGRVIERVETTEDSIVYCGVTHDEFAAELQGRKVKDVGRRGKVFFLEIEPDGERVRMPVLHLGMTGMLQARGQDAVYYRQKPRQDPSDWPPKFMKFIFHIAPTDTLPAVELAFLDPRRLGRVRLCMSPLEEPPISTLGFDPILSMINLDDFSVQVVKRKCAIKALLLDQSFSAGIGNWIADEVLFHSRVHPEQKAHTLSTDQITLLHEKIVYVCQSAVDVNADASKFPENWLFRHRWGKGKKGITKDPLRLPTGGTAIIKWIKVGGRTSAYVPELQKLPASDVIPGEGQVEDSSELSSPESGSRNIDLDIGNMRLNAGKKRKRANSSRSKRSLAAEETGRPPRRRSSRFVAPEE